MGKRSRRQKKGAVNPDASTNPVPDKSPKITGEKFCFSENQVNNNMKSVRSPASDQSSKITSYFPKSPEGRLRPAGPSTSAGAKPEMPQDADNEGEQLCATNAVLPSLGLLTPDTTPTKESTQPPPRPSHHPSPPNQQPPERQNTPSERADRPKVAQKLEYGAQGDREEGIRDGGTTGEKTDGWGGTKRGDGKRSKGDGRGRTRRSRQPKQVQSPTVTLKDFYPVRRSNRQCKSALEAAETKKLHDAVLSGKEEGLEVQDILGKGRGVIATRTFSKGDFVVEYYGDHIDINTAKEREQEYAANPAIGCYMYYYQYKNKSYCVDATAESGRIGRLLNHSKSGNCTTKLISIEDKPYLILVAARPIPVGEELLYDYGDRNKESLQSHPWLAL